MKKITEYLQVFTEEDDDDKYIVAGVEITQEKQGADVEIRVVCDDEDIRLHVAALYQKSMGQLITDLNEMADNETRGEDNDAQDID